MIDLNALVGKFGELSKGDMAAAFVAGTAGAVIDGIWNPLVAFTWQQTGMLAATGALGVKKSIESAFADSIERRGKRKLGARARARAEKLLNVLNEDKHASRIAVTRRLQESLKLFDLEIITSDEFKTYVDEAVNVLRDEQP